MATDPNQILATAMPAAGAIANPFVDAIRGNSHSAVAQPFGFPRGGMPGLLQAAQAADPNAWSSFLAQPWGQNLQQRFGLTPDALTGLQQALAGMNTPHDVRQYFQGNFGQPGGGFAPPQVGMVPGVPGSMGTNPAAGQGPVMSPGPVIAPQPAAPPQQQHDFRNPMLPAGFSGFGGGGGGQVHPAVAAALAGVARQPGAPGFGL